jgi:hypothetical protein
MATALAATVSAAAITPATTEASTSTMSMRALTTTVCLTVTPTTPRNLLEAIPNRLRLGGTRGIRLLIGPCFLLGDGSCGALQPGVGLA